MSDVLSRLAPPEGAVRAGKRVGRGRGSGLGKTCGRGQKGQKTRSGGNINKLAFQGGQTPLQRRVPKRGFRNPFAARVAVVNVGDLERFEAGTTVDEAKLRQARLVRGAADRIKILGEGDLSRSLTVVATSFSGSAKAKIERAGGKAVALPVPAEAS